MNDVEPEWWANGQHEAPPAPYMDVDDNPEVGRWQGLTRSHDAIRIRRAAVIFTFATRCLNCHVCLDLPIHRLQVTRVAGHVRWSYSCPLCGGWCNREAKPAQIAAFAVAGIVPRQEMAAISEADVERFAAELEAMPSAVRG